MAPLAATVLLAGCGSDVGPQSDDGATGEEWRGVATTWPAPATPAPDDPAAPPPFGFSPGAGLRDLDDAHLAGDLAAVASAGAAWIRLDVDWSVVEVERGDLDWSEHDRLIEAAMANDLRVLAMVAYTPSWARPSGSSDKHPPDEEADFVRFVSAAVDRYSPLGVSAWQVWNEPNSSLFWSTGPDPERYGRLLAAATEAIRAADPDATIVSGGLAPAVDRPEDGWLSPETYLRELVATGALADVDAVGIHPYSFPARPLDPESAPWNTFLRLPTLFDIVAEVDDGPAALWITEYGAPTGTNQRAVSEADQALLVVEALEAAGDQPWLGPVFLYALRDLRYAPDDLEWNYGVLNNDGTPKQAWHDLQARLTG